MVRALGRFPRGTGSNHAFQKIYFYKLHITLCCLEKCNKEYNVLPLKSLRCSGAGAQISVNVSIGNQTHARFAFRVIKNIIFSFSRSPRKCLKIQRKLENGFVLIRINFITIVSQVPSVCTAMCVIKSATKKKIIIYIFVNHFNLFLNMFSPTLCS